MPNWRKVIREQLSGLRLSPTREAEITEEIEQHLNDRYQHLLSGGANEHEAYITAVQELVENDSLFKGLRRVERSTVQEPVVPGAQSKRNFLEDFTQDIRYGLRTMMKNPGFTVVAVIALALGIGANTAIFSVVNTVLLRPLPYKDPDRLVMVWEDASQLGFPHNTPAPANYIDWRDQNQAFEGMSALHRMSFNLTGVGEPERLDGRRVSANLFSLLGVEPQLGRKFLLEDDTPGKNHVVMLSHTLWQRRFGSDASIIGKSIDLNGESFTVVGVMPSEFQFPSREDELWVPIAFDSAEASRRGSHYLEVLARTRPGVTLEQAQAEMNTIAARLEQQNPQTNAKIGAKVIPLHEDVVGDIKPALLLLLGAVGFVLLVACANVANLLLVRAAVRQKEIALRVALGASRSRLIRQFLTESVLLAVLGGIVGLSLSFIGLLVLKTFIPENISQAKFIAMDARVLLFTAGVSLITGLIFGLAPATQAANFNLNETLKEGGRDSASGNRGNRIRSLLVIAEVAVSLVLLIGAALLINSFLRLRNVDPGFRSDNLLTMRIVLPELKYSDQTRRSAFYSELVNRVEALPGVRAAAVTNWIPLVFQGDSVGISIEGRTDPTMSQRPNAVTRVISPHYFRAMSIQLLQGRELDERDKADSPGVVVISETMARRFWPGENPIGKRLTPGSPQSSDGWLEVIGVVRDVRQFQLSAEPKPQMYLSYRQAEFFAPRHLVVSTNVAPLSLAETVRRTVWEIDKDQPVSHILSMDEVVAESISRQRFSMLLLGIFAAVALVLAAVGIYGVMSYSVEQRTHEIGIRMALGAQTRAVIKLAVGRELRLVSIGLAIGLVAALMLTRVMSTLLFGISATDPTTFVVIALVLISVALLASYIPARRATKVDPMIALRYE
jgi:putative ABC transport system permease protein